MELKDEGTESPSENEPSKPGTRFTVDLGEVELTSDEINGIMSAIVQASAERVKGARKDAALARTVFGSFGSFGRFGRVIVIRN